MSTITVSPNNSIQNAINSSHSGDTILIKNGLYNQLINVTKPLLIQGEILPTQPPISTPTQPIIDGTNLLTTDEGILVTLSASNVTVKGLKIQNSTGYAIRNVNSQKNINVSNNYIQHIKYGAIVLHYCENLTIYKNKLEDTSYNNHNKQETVSIASSNQVEISHNYGLNNPLEGGFYLKDGVRNARMHHNYLDRSGNHGIYLDGWEYGLHNIEIDHNIIINRGFIELTAELRKDTSINENINIHDNIIYNAEGIRFPTLCPGYGTGRPTFKNIRIQNNTIYKCTIGLELGSWRTPYNPPLGPGCTVDPIYSDIIIRGNKFCTRSSPHSTPGCNKIFIQKNHIPSTSYNSDIMTSNSNSIIESEFQTTFNKLKSEIEIPI